MAKNKNWSKKQIALMKQDLLNLGYSAELDTMDDQNLIGFWQSEMGYLEPDE